jgi:RNA recognition motif-containing protein
MSTPNDQQPQQQDDGSQHQANATGDPFPASTIVLRMRGLPYTARDSDVRDFFAQHQVDTAQGSVVVVTHGFQRGEAYVRFVSPAACATAYEACNRAHMDKRYIELYPSTPGALDLQFAAEEQLASNHRYFIRLRGLPFQAGEGNIREFLEPLGYQAVLSVHLCTAADGRFNGNAFVELNSEHAVRDAMERLNKAQMGTRYIEIFESSMLERDASMMAERRRRRVDPSGGRGGRGRGGGGMPPHGYQPQHPSQFPHPNSAIPAPQYYGQYQQQHQGFSQQQQQQQRPAYPVVRLRGLPFSANESTIAEFLHGVNIPPQGVHMVYDANERPTGEAFVEVVSEADVQAATAMHNRTLGRRYIEVFRSSQGEMHRLQMGEAPVPEGYYGTNSAFAPPPPTHQPAPPPGYTATAAPFGGHRLPVGNGAQQGWN